MGFFATLFGFLEADLFGEGFFFELLFDAAFAASRACSENGSLVVESSATGSLIAVVPTGLVVSSIIRSFLPETTLSHDSLASDVQIACTSLDTGHVRHAGWSSERPNDECRADGAMLAHVLNGCIITETFFDNRR
jgi:hypothetical protein